MKKQIIITKGHQSDMICGEMLYFYTIQIDKALTQPVTTTEAFVCTLVNSYTKAGYEVIEQDVEDVLSLVS